MKPVPGFPGGGPWKPDGAEPVEFLVPVLFIAEPLFEVLDALPDANGFGIW